MAAPIIQAMPQVLPQPLMNSIVSATPFYSQNALDPNVYSLLLSTLGHSFTQHSQIVGIPQAYNTFNNAFQTAIQQPQTQFTNIYQEMMPSSCQSYPSNPCQLPISTQVELLPTVLNQHISAVNTGQLCCNNNMNQVLGQQLLTQISTQPSCTCITAYQGCCASLTRMIESPPSNNGAQNQILMLLAQILQKMDDRDIYIQNHNVNTNTNTNSNVNSNNNNNNNNLNNGVNLQGLTGLFEQLLTKTNNHPYLPVIVATKQGSIYDAILTYLGQQASTTNNPNNPYSVLRSWLIDHPNQLSSSNLQQILFWILHPQINNVQTFNVPNIQNFPQILGSGNNMNTNTAIPNINTLLQQLLGTTASPNSPLQNVPLSQNLGVQSVNTQNSNSIQPFNINSLLQQIGQIPGTSNINLNGILQQLGQTSLTSNNGNINANSNP